MFIITQQGAFECTDFTKRTDLDQFQVRNLQRKLNCPLYSLRKNLKCFK